MGNTKPVKVVQPSMEDNLIEMRIQSKSIARSGQKSKKQAAAYQKKAKQALKKNNEEAAKMYLMQASQHQKEALSCQRTAMKMQFMCGQIKSMKNNQKLMNTFGMMTQAVSGQMNNFDATKMMEQMDQFNGKMDQMMINNKMIQQITDSNPLQTNQIADDMLNVLKQQITMEEQGKFENVGPGLNINNKDKNVYEDQNFINDLKGL